MRGKLLGVAFRADVLRITPACAGKTLSPCRPCTRRADHPRVCGENDKYFPMIYKRGGSPPRVRGKHRKALHLAGFPRITPACAGKTRAIGSLGFRMADHPRVCGENAADEAGETVNGGSPPRVRGKLYRIRVIVPHARITPACAGKTPTGKLKPTVLTDHPRVCGENSTPGPLMSVSHGSPPRVRGKPHLPDESTAHWRITPACAGKTLLPPPGTRRMSDHPRVCGEN